MNTEMLERRIGVDGVRRPGVQAAPPVEIGQYEILLAEVLDYLEELNSAPRNKPFDALERLKADELITVLFDLQREAVADQDATSVRRIADQRGVFQLTDSSRSTVVQLPSEVRNRVPAYVRTLQALSDDARVDSVCGTEIDELRELIQHLRFVASRAARHARRRDTFPRGLPALR